MLPLFPLFDTPDPISNAPLLPVLAVPVDMATKPLTPWPPALAVCRMRLPLLYVELYPVVTNTVPPVA